MRAISTPVSLLGRDGMRYILRLVQKGHWLIILLLLCSCSLSSETAPGAAEPQPAAGGAARVAPTEMRPTAVSLAAPTLAPSPTAAPSATAQPSPMITATSPPTATPTPDPVAGLTIDDLRARDF